MPFKFDSCPDLTDVNLETYSFVNGLLASPYDAVSTKNETSPSNQKPDDNKPEEDVEVCVKTIITHGVQGSSLPLSNLILQISELLQSTRQKILSLDKESINSFQLKLVDAIEKLTEPSLVGVDLKEKILSVAERKFYGNKSKNTSLFEDTDICGLFRWEINSFLLVSKHYQNVIKEVRSNRNRFGQAMKATARTIEQLQKIPYDESKVSVCEERLSKSVSDVEKYKERRKEMEMKRSKESEEKNRKEELKEQKRKELEGKKLALLESKAASSTEKTQRVPSEKELKNAQVLEKQKNMFLSFLKTVSKPPVQSSSSISASNKVVSASDDAEIREELLHRFTEALDADISILDIFRFHKKRYLDQKNNPSRQKRPHRKPKKITVTVTSVDNNNGFGDETANNIYSEIKEVLVDSRIRTFSFHEDYRPAYVGTVSKNSNIVTGRRPFSRDNELINYEYDSEGEWEEEEVEGEDIAESDEEEEEGGNELEYDDFFRQDNDFGSDVDSDGEELTAAVNIGSKREREEVLGIRFIDHLDLELSDTAGLPDPDRHRLSMYMAVVFSSQEGAPPLPLLLNQMHLSSLIKSNVEIAPIDGSDYPKAVHIKGFDEQKV